MSAPLDVGAVQVTVADAAPATAVTAPGAPGFPDGVTGALGVLAAPGPTAFVAVTVNVYAVPFVRPPTTADRAPPVAATTIPPGWAVIWYDVTGEPLSAAAVQVTV